MWKEHLRKSIVVTLGSIIMGIGISLTIASNLGSDPMTLLWVGLSNTLSISIGQANVLVSAIILIFVFFLDKSHISVGSLLNPIVIAITTEVCGQFIVPIESMILSSIVCLLGLLLLAFGIACYASINYGKGAYEALVFCISEKIAKPISVLRMFFDISFALLGVLLHAQFAIGTLLAIVCMGPSIGLFLKAIMRCKKHL